ncbi:MAG: spore coat protein [Candidatus Melainabacteria bacterium RIFOXYA12_FULL_32_12]|nr:MAG: spore coat protein [Candidatus Melainabacteria bacterium RIFOXYA2_FULL_32_9]OGI31812.1 MAG: spore coat protein [Candidatus Melainabacteria bacterium RIFOXYA12_FULL_32_12]
MILAILQVRTSSSRLPNKVLLPVLDKPMLIRQIERIKKSKLIDKLVVATSIDISDNPIEKLCIDNHIEYFRGSLNDVLERFYDCAQKYKPEHIVRLTGDCPVIDPEILDKTIEYHLNNDFDYTSNGYEPVFPDGLDVEAFKYECLTKAQKEASLPSHREHVTQFIHTQKDIYKLGNYKETKNLSHLRWTVDEPEDFILITKIYEELYPQNPDFKMQDILDLLDKKPELTQINSKFERNEGLKKSIDKDKEFLKNKNVQ